MLQRIILIAAVLLVLSAVAIVLSHLFYRSNVDDIDLRPERFRRQFPK